MTSSKKIKGGDELAPGQPLLGRYLIDRFLDEGGMASIYLATDLRSGVKLAIKCLHTQYHDNAVVRARFIDEGRIQMMLTHPNIVRVYELIERPVLAFVMELVVGGTLEEYLQERGVLPLGEILEVAIPTMSALGLAHSHGIIHRDLKPSNILMQRALGAIQPKVMDFGVAKLKRTHDLTATGTTVGTLHYMSPEQIVGSKHIDGRADIYSMGITLYKLCTGEVPFNASTEFALMMSQVETPPRPPRELNPGVCPHLEEIILRALAKKPQDRYQSVKDFTSALMDLYDDGPETVDMDVLPMRLLEFAMMADGVAVDRTDEVVLRTRELRELGLQPDAHPAHDNSTTETFERMPAVTGHSATEMDSDELEDFGLATLQDEAGTSNATMEVSTDFLNELSEMDAVQHTPRPWSDHTHDEAQDITLQDPFALPPKGEGPVRTIAPRAATKAPALGAPHHPVIGHGESEITTTTPRSPTSDARPAHSGPPRVFGPAFVDTREKTRPKLFRKDLARQEDPDASRSDEIAPGRVPSPQPARSSRALLDRSTSDQGAIRRALPYGSSRRATLIHVAIFLLVFLGVFLTVVLIMFQIMA